MSVPTLKTYSNHTNKVRNSRRRRGFTLVEILVVVAIIVILSALLTPAIMRALVSARNARLAIEIAQLKLAIETYKQKTGDYPPSLNEYFQPSSDYWDEWTAAVGGSAPAQLRVNSSILMRHLRTAYPKIDQLAVSGMFYEARFLDQSESMVFFLSKTTDDARHPFVFDDTLNPDYALSNSIARPIPIREYYPFPGRQLQDLDGDGRRSFKPAFGKDSAYIYADARLYNPDVAPAGAPFNGIAYHYDVSKPNSGLKIEVVGTLNGWAINTPHVVRPYVADPTPTSTLIPQFPYYRPINQTTYQILCPGLDGLYTSTVDYIKRVPSLKSLDPANLAALTDIPLDLQQYTDDRDNLMDSSEGKTLADLGK